MNKTFKVARSLTRGTVVTSEKASSYQGKAVKTVIAAAVASLVAGAAMAANTVYVADGAALTFGSDGAESPQATVTLDSGKVYSDEKLTTEIKASALATNDTIYLVGGTVSVNAADQVPLNATASQLTKGTLTLSSFDSASSGKQQNATVTYSGTEAVGNVTIEFAANTGSGENKGVSTLTSSEDAAFTLGEVADQTTGHGAKVTTLKTATGAAGTVAAKTGQDLVLNNVAFGNQGELTLSGKKVTFNTAYEGQSGKLIVQGAADINDAFSSSKVVIGDASKVDGETASFNESVTVGEKGSFTADQLTINSTPTLALQSGATAEIGTADITSGGISLTGDATHKTAVTVGTLNLKGTANGLNIEQNTSVTGETINSTGTNGITNAGTLSYKAVNVTVADKTASNLTIDNASGKATLGAVTVTASSDASAALTVSGASGVATAGDIVLSGYAAGQTASLKVEGTDPGTDSTTKEQKYNLTADSLAINAYATATLNAAKVLVNGDVNVAANGSLVIDAANETTVKKTLTFAKDAAAFTNSGTLTVGTLVNNVAITNSGTLEITGVDGATSVNAGTILSDADKNVTVAGNFDNQLYADSTKNSATNLTASTLTVSKGTFNNAGIVDVTTLTLDEGAVYNTTYLTEAPTNNTATTTYTEAETINVNEGAILNIADLNQASIKDGANDQLAIVSDINLYGGVLQVRGASTETVDVVLSKTLTVGEKSEQTFKSVLANTDGKLQISGGKVTVTGTLETSGGSVNLMGGDLDVSADGAKIFTDKKDSFMIVDDGYLTTTADALGMTIEKNAFKFAATTIDSKDHKFNGLTNEGEVSIAGLSGSFDKAATLKTEVEKYFGTLSKAALVELGNVAVEDLKLTEGTYDADKVAELSGIVLNVLKNATISNVSNQTLNGQYGKLILADKTSELASSDYTILTNNGNLVETKDGKLAGVTVAANKIFAYRGAEGATGTVKYVTVAKASAPGSENGLLAVEAGTLDVQGSVAQSADGTGQGGDVEVDENAGLIVNGDLNITNLDTEGAVTVKNYTDANGEVTLGVTTVAESFNVAATGSFTTAGKTMLTNGGTVLGTATFGELEAGTLNVGNGDQAGHATIGNLLSGTVTFDPEFDKETQTIAIEKASTGAVLASKEVGKTNVLDASIVGIGAGASESEAVAAFTATGWGLGQRNHKQDDGSILNKDAELVTAVVAVNTLNADTQKHETFGGILNVGDATKTSGVNFEKDTMLIVDATKVDTTGAVQIFGQEVTFDEKAELALTNIGNGDKIVVGKFAEGSEENFAGKVEDTVFTGDILMDAGLVVDNKNVGTITVGMIDKVEVIDVLGDLPGLDAAYDMFATRANLGSSSSVAFNNWLYSSANQTSYQGIRNAAKDVAGLGATTGVQTLTMDAVNQMADTVADRTSILTQRGQGVNVWADVNGGKFEAKTLFDGAGYSSDIYSGVLGLDYQFSCNAVLGAALTIGTADTDSKNSAFKASTDSDLVGFSVYASKTFADIWNVSADIGYLQASNDVTANGYAHAWKFSEDTDAWTVGVRGEVLTKAGSVNIVPHLGLRYTAISTDGFEAGYVTDIDDQNVFQMPVGVTVSADFETNGWTIAPKFDLSVVPTFGDKDAELKLGLAGVAATATDSVRVIDSNPVQAQLGINATNGAWGFGLNYKLGVGSEDRMNNSFNANVRYAF